jgi:hypothetical protein
MAIELMKSTAITIMNDLSIVAFIDLVPHEKIL